MSDKTVISLRQKQLALKNKRRAKKLPHVNPQGRRGVIVETLPHGEIKFVPLLNNIKGQTNDG